MNRLFIFGVMIIFLGVSLSSVIAVKDDYPVESIGKFKGSVLVFGICDSISSDDTVVHVTVGNGKLVTLLIGYKWLSHFEWIPHIGFLKLEAVKINNFKGIVKNNFILGIGRIEIWITKS